MFFDKVAIGVYGAFELLANANLVALVLVPYQLEYYSRHLGKLRLFEDLTVARRSFQSNGNDVVTMGKQRRLLVCCI